MAIALLLAFLLTDAAMIFAGDGDKRFLMFLRLHARWRLRILR